MTNAFVATVVVLLVVILVLELLRRKAGRKAAEAQRSQATAEVRLAPLVKYEAIVDAEAASATMRAEAQADADRTREEARLEVRDSRSKAREALDAAIAESKRILESASLQAQDIAGDALKAKDKAEHYARAARAMKNIIDGYGDQYLIANRSVLDDLAEEFGHREAGQRLKGARSHTRGLVKNGLAADCDYVEDNRRTTAIQFVLDAFNGKVDSALSKVRHNNFGKLKQEILDGCGLVNKNGRAFRNARINPDYLEARLNELKWAVATHELKLEEREEQRQIREAMREEERARREYEKAQRDALKEEKLLEKAMAKAREQLEAASEEQKAAYEAQLADLQAKYDEAEARNQRAISMAQQTRRGHVYVISNIGSFGEDVLKVGLTRRLEPTDRVRELGDASVPFPFDVHAMIHSEDAPALETKLHKKIANAQVNLVNHRKEFFKISIGELRSVVEELGIEVHWTMTAEAREYRETLAMESSAGDEIPDQKRDEPDLVEDFLSDL